MKLKIHNPDLFARHCGRMGVPCDLCLRDACQKHLSPKPLMRRKRMRTAFAMQK